MEDFARVRARLTNSCAACSLRTYLPLESQSIHMFNVVIFLFDRVFLKHFLIFRFNDLQLLKWISSMVFKGEKALYDTLQ